MNMRNFLPILIFLGLILTFCKKEDDFNVSAGAKKLELRETPTFFGVVIKDGLSVTVSPDTLFGVSVNGPEGYLPFIKTDIVNGAMEISLDDRVKVKDIGAYEIILHPVWASVDTFKVTNLRRIELYDGSSFKSDLFCFDKFMKCIVSGGSALFGSFLNEEADFSISGGSIVNAMGKLASSNIKLSGGSFWNGFDCTLETSNIVGSGASNIQIYSDGAIDFEGSGASILEFKGTPNIQSKLVGGAKVVDRN
jgi:hypothetical protein